MRSILIISLGFMSGLSACARIDTAIDCTHMIAATGGLYQFCADGSQIKVSETGIADKDQVKEITNDPVALAALSADVKPLAKFMRSRKIVAKVCAVDRSPYISIRATDLRRVIRLTQGRPILAEGL